MIITNGSYAPWFPFRKKQYLINTWHGGGAYKKIENDKPDANWATRKRAEFCDEKYTADRIKLSGRQVTGCFAVHFFTMEKS